MRQTAADVRFLGAPGSTIEAAIGTVDSLELASSPTKDGHWPRMLAGLEYSVTFGSSEIESVLTSIVA